jgi:hypothetical protein
MARSLYETLLLTEICQVPNDLTTAYSDFPQGATHDTSTKMVETVKMKKAWNRYLLSATKASSLECINSLKCR